VIGNLLTNAAKYTDEGGRITVTADVEASQVVVRVQDTGVGISTEMLPRVFDWFAQVDGLVGRAKVGMGVGLALVRGVVGAHYEGPGKGSEFVVRLPVP
jgi:signal transduction histidine kinase